jgi:hypothetical protein
LGREAVGDNAVLAGVDAGGVTGVQFNSVEAAFPRGSGKVLAGLLGFENDYGKPRNRDDMVRIIELGGRPFSDLELADVGFGEGLGF